MARYVDEAAFHEALLQAAYDGNGVPAIFEAFEAFHDRDERHYKGYTIRDFATGRLMSMAAGHGSYRSASEALEIIALGNDVDIPSYRTVYRDVAHLDESVITLLGQQLLTTVAALHANALAAADPSSEVDLAMDEFDETTGSKTWLDLSDADKEAGVRLTSSGSRGKLDKKTIRLLKDLGRKARQDKAPLIPNPFRDSGTRAHETMAVFAFLSDEARYFLQAYQTNGVGHANADFIRNAKVAVDEMVRRGVKLRDFMLDARWDDQASVDALREMEGDLNWILRARDIGDREDEERHIRPQSRQVKRRREAARAAGKIPEVRRKLAERLFPTKVAVPGRSNTFVAWVRTGAFQGDLGKSTLVIMYVLKHPKKYRGEPLVLGVNMKAIFFLTSYPATEEAAKYVCVKARKRWLAEEEIRDYKQQRKKGSGGKMTTRALRLQDSAILKAIATYVHYFHTRRHVTKRTYVRYTYNAMMMRASWVAVQAAMKTGFA
jgi:hypothetical protein